jgi:drug/metabolite transporter (DMT)-like permease
VSASLVSFVGVVVTAFLGKMGGFHFGTGELLIAIAALVLAVATVIIKSRLQLISIGVFSIFRTLIGTFVFFILANLLYGSHHFAEAFSPYLWAWMILYAAVIVVIGQLCWLAGLKNANAAQINLASCVNPIAAILMAYLILGEVPTTAQYIGGAIILVGIILSAIANFHHPITPQKLNSAQMMAMVTGFRGL